MHAGGKRQAKLVLRLAATLNPSASTALHRLAMVAPLAMALALVAIAAVIIKAAVRAMVVAEAVPSLWARTVG